MKQEHNAERKLYDALEDQVRTIEELYGTGNGTKDKDKSISDVRFVTDLKAFVNELIRDRKLCERFRDLELRNLKYSIAVSLDSDSLRFSISEGASE